MRGYQNRPVTPRNGHTLVVGIVARISGCQNQKELSLEDQLDHGKQVLAEYYQGEVDYRPIATKGKGERLDRPELDDIEKLLRTRELDFLIAEDIGRMVRGTEAARLCGVAVDHGVRVIAPNDCIDTADDSWEEEVISACRDHVGHNAHTSKRIKHKMMNRFKKLGAAPPLPVFGYIKSPDAKTLDDWQKDDAATPVVQEGLRRLKASLNCSAVADWFTQQKVPLGKYCRRKKWNGAMVRRFYRNPILKGQPGRGFRHTVKVNESGRRVSVKNPNGPVFRDCPHLAHVDALAFDELNALLDAKNSRFGRKLVNGVDPLYRVPRRRTRFPGQHARCWYCGRRFVWGGNGVTENLMCAGSRERCCWNSIGFNGELAMQRLMDALTSELYQLDGFDDHFRELVSRALEESHSGLSDRYAKLATAEQTLAHRKANLVEAVASYGPQPMFADELSQLAARERELALERSTLDALTHTHNFDLPASVAELRSLLEQKFQGLARKSPEFGDLLRELVPDFFVYHVRLCDGGHLCPRMKVRLALGGAIPDTKHVPQLTELLTRDVTIDLFDPPQRERIRPQVVQLAAEGVPQRKIMTRLPERATLPAVQRSFALHRKMQELGLGSPYVLVEAPPEDYAKLRRHLHTQYHFSMLEGYERPPL